MYLAANTLRGECRMYLEEEEETIEIIDWNNNTVKYECTTTYLLYNYV